MNIFFTNLCNRNCPYCFAQDKIAGDKRKPSFLLLKELGQIVAFLKKSRETSVGIVGGEPTLHPDFQRLMSFVLAQGMEVVMFSNGIIREDVVDFLKRNAFGNLTILLNMRPLRTYSKKEKRTLIRTLEALAWQIQLAFTIDTPGFNADFMIGMINKYGLRKRIRLGIANPLLGTDNTYIPFTLHKKIAPTICAFVQKCDAADISVNFDCGFTLCSFSEAQIGKLHLFNALFNSYCEVAPDVGPNLEVWRCFATSNILRKKLSAFKNIQEIRDFYAKKMAAFRKVGADKKCLGCKYLRRKQCGGGCLVHTLLSFGAGRKDIEIKPV